MTRVRSFPGGLFLLILLVFPSSFSLLYRQIRLWPKIWGQDDVSVQETRFRKIEPGMPSLGTVGYQADKRFVSAKNMLDLAYDYSVAQYALSPLVLIEGIEQDLVIMNLKSPGVPREIMPQGNWEILQSSGDGVFLLRRVPP